MEMISHEMLDDIVKSGKEQAQKSLKELYKIAEEKGLPFAISVMSETGQLLCAKSLVIAVEDEEHFKDMLKELIKMIEMTARAMAQEEKNEGGRWLN
jgi:Ni,Fe-hydrogenase maturation factor